MKLHRLVLTNYRGIAHRDIEFPDHGVVVVCGANEIGKSSMIEALDLLVGLFEMGFETLRKIAICRLVDHLRQRLGDLLLGVIDILQTVQHQVVHCFDVFRKQSHVILH